MHQKEAETWFEQFSRISVLHVISVNYKLTPVINQTLEMLQTRIYVMWALNTFITSCWGIFDQFLFILLCFNQHNQPLTDSNAVNPLYTSGSGSITARLSLLSAHSHICPPELEMSGLLPRAAEVAAAQSCVSAVSVINIQKSCK